MPRLLAPKNARRAVLLQLLIAAWASTRAAAQGCVWQGHCFGDPCKTANDCDGALTCGSNGKCGGGVGPYPTPSQAVPGCVWQGHCFGDPCKTANDCDGALTCGSNGKCGGGVGPYPTPSQAVPGCVWQGHCFGDPCGNDNDCDGALTCGSNGKCGGGGSVGPSPPVQSSDGARLVYLVSSDIHIGRGVDPVDDKTPISPVDRIQEITNVINTGFLGTSKASPAPTGWVINGDLTEFYQDISGTDQPSSAFQLVDAVGITHYRGMGNHDFGNNLDDCTYQCGGGWCWGVGAGDKFGCAGRAIRDFLWDNLAFRGRQQPSTVVSFDKRSGAYHWVEQDWSFFMLHRNPAMQFGRRCYPSVVGPCSCNCAGQYSYSIDSVISNGWLESELKAATGAGRKIILFMHQIDAADKPNSYDSREDGEFKRLLALYSVVGIFVGHTHIPEWLEGDGDIAGIPVINSGAAWYRMFLHASFADASYTVRVADTSTGDWMQQGKLVADYSITKPSVGKRYVNNVAVTYTLAQDASGWKVIKKRTNFQP